MGDWLTTRSGQKERFGLAVAAAVTSAVGLLAVRLLAGTLTSITPAGASPQVIVALIGTGLNATAASNEVTFSHPDGTTRTTPGVAITTLDAARKRLSTRVPDGVPVGRVSVSVRNTATGETSDGIFLDVIQIALPEVTSAVRGTTGVKVRITGSANVVFAAGQTTAAFGAGVTVKSVTVESPTSLVAVIDIAATAAEGSRTVQTRTSVQSGLLENAFRVLATAPPNQNPTANAGGPYSGFTGQPIVFDGTGSSDPDKDALTYTWDFGDGAKGTGATPSHSYSSAGQFTVSLTVSDGRGGGHTATSTATIAAPNANPTANAGGPYKGLTGTPVAFDGTGSSDPDKDPLTYAWDFGDGNKDTGATPSHTYTAAGPYTVSLTVSDGRGGTATATASVGIAQANRAPTAHAGGPYKGNVGTPVSFDGTGSSDPDNDPLTYAWDFGDGSKGSGATPSHTYKTSGSYTISLTVTDGRGGSHTATSSITVGAELPPNRPPQASAGGPYSGLTGQPIAFDAKGSTDPDGDTLTYAWDFGDDNKGSGVSPAHTYGQTGNYKITLTVSDGRGGSHTASSVADVGTPAAGNRPPSAHAGGPYSSEVSTLVSLNASLSHDPDGDTLTYAWNFGDGIEGTGSSPSHAYKEPGDYTVTVTVTDGRGGSHSASATVHVAAAQDHMPPVVTLNAPKEALPGTQVTVTAQAGDNVAVTGVDFEVGGASPSSLVQPPYTRVVQIPAVAAPGDTVEVKALARDPSNNIGSASALITIVAAPDTTPPVVVLNAPAEIGRGATLLVSAQVTDAVGVREVVFTIDGQETVIEAGKPAVASFAVAADRPLTAPVNVVVRARDFAGNQGDAAAVVQIVAEKDTTPPTVTQTSPDEVPKGTPLTIAAEVKDDVGVAAVELVVNGVVVQTVTNPPFALEFVVPETLLTGALLDVKIVVRDFSGNTGETSVVIPVTSPTALVRSAVTGEVYDDTTGLPLDGARVQVGGSGAVLAVTDARGRFSVPVPAGSADVTIAKEGWTSVHRRVDLLADNATEMFDARLTRLSDTPSAVSAVLGGSVETTGYALDLAAGALPSGASVKLTPLSPQGLPALLPTGWSPIAAVFVGPESLVLVGAQSLRGPPRAELTGGRAVAIARFDPASRVWSVVATGTIGSGGALPPVAIPGGGSYAWVVGDALPSPAPPAVAGEPLGSAGAASVPEDATAVINPQPKVIFYKPGVFSDVGNRVVAGQTLRSGSHAQIHVSESYRFFSGLQQHPEPFTQDLVLYQAADASALEARHRVTPSLTFEAAALELGVITLDFDIPAPGARLTPLIGAEGGVVTGAAGEQLRLPANSGADGRSFGLQRLTVDQLGLTLPGGLSFVGAVAVSFSGVLEQPGVLSIPIPAGLLDASGVLVARAQLIGGEDRLVLVAAARIVGDRLESDTTLGGNPAAFEGITTGGRYVFVRPTTLFGFVTGGVAGVDGAPFSGALVSTPTLGLVALSRAAGYILAGALGTIPVTALDVVRLDSGAGQGTVTAPRAVTTVPLALGANPPSVLSITPAHQAVNVPLGSAIVARFSRPIDAASAVVGGSVKLSGPGGASVPGSMVWTLNGTTLTFRPTSALLPNLDYTFSLSTALRDLTGRALAAAASARFGSLDTNPPPVPPAGSINASIPDANGRSSVRGTQGTAGRNDTVTILNVTRGTSTPVILDPDGGFLTLVDATISDKLRVRIVDAAGNEIFVDLARFRSVNADGSVTTFVGPEGGKIEGPNGSAVDVPKDAFPDGVTMTLTYVPETQFPISLTEGDKKFFAYTAGLKIDMGGVQPAGGRYLNLSFAPQGGETADDQWIVGHVFQSGANTFFNMVDTAKMIRGRITTSSPPCPGVQASETYAAVKSLNRPVGVNWARTWNNGDQLRRVNHAISDFYAQLGAVHSIGSGTLLGAMTSSTLYGTVRAFASDLNPPSVCLPSLSGRVTIVPNTVQLTVAADQLLPGDSRVTVRNTTRGAERVLPMYAAALNVAVTTLGANYFEVRAEMSASTSQDLGSTAPDSPPAFFKTTAGTNGQTVVAVQSDWLTAAPRAIVVNQVFNIAKAATDDRGPQGIAFRLNGASTDYRVFFVRDDGSEDELEALQFKVTRISETQVEVLIDTVERLEASIASYRAKHETRVALEGLRPLHLNIEGALGESYAVEVSRTDAATRTVTTRPVSFTKSGTPGGNLILKVLPATVDPPLPLGSTDLGRLAGSVAVFNKTTGESVSISDSELAEGQGGTEKWFTGDPAHDYEFVIGYNGQDAGPQLPTTRIIREADKYELHIPIPKVELTVYDLTSLTPIKTISAFAPPRNEPMNIGRLDNDTTVPTLLTTAAELTDIDPSKPFTLRFSESMDPQSLVQGVFLECGGQNIAGEIRVFDENRSVAFVPTGALPLDKSCTVFLQVSDASGNLITAQQSSIPLTTFKPVLVGTSLEMLNLRDIAHLTQQEKQTVVGVSRGSSTYQVTTIDVTNPAEPVVAGVVPASTFATNATTWRIVAVPGVTKMPLRTVTDPAEDNVSECRGGRLATSFAGDIAVIGRYNVNMSGVQFFNITNPTTPCMLGEKYLTADPTGVAYDRLITGTIHLPGYAKGVTAIKTAGDVMAYAAVQDVGLLTAPVGAHSPQPLLPQREVPGATYGNYADVVSIRDRVFALELIVDPPSPTLGRVDVFTPTLGFLGSTDAQVVDPRGLLAVEGYTRDDNANGIIDPSEQRDLLFVASATTIVIFEVTDPRAPVFRASIPFDGHVRGKMSFDLSRKWLAAISDTGVPTVFDISTLDFTPASNREVWEADKGSAETVAFDSARGLLYVGRYTQNLADLGQIVPEPRGVLDVWDVGGVRPSLSVQATANGLATATVNPDEDIALDGIVTARAVDELEFEWSLSNGTKKSGKAQKTAYAKGGVFLETLSVTPVSHPHLRESSSVPVHVAQIASIQIQSIESPVVSDARTTSLVGEPALRLFPDYDAGIDSRGSLSHLSASEKTLLRRQVRVRVQTTSAAAGTKVYLRFFDIDDPSSDDDPLDSNGSAPGDNRSADARWITPSSTSCGSPDQNILTIRTAAGGVAVAQFAVSHRPGDNYRVVAATSCDKIAAATVHPVDTVSVQAPADAGMALVPVEVPNGSLPPTLIRAAQILTVWRRLEIRADIMAQVNGNTLLAAIPYFDGNEVHVKDVMNSNGSTADVNDGSRSPGRFAQGTLTVMKNSRRIISSESGEPGRINLAQDLIVPCELRSGTVSTPCSITKLSQETGITAVQISQQVEVGPEGAEVIVNDVDFGVQARWAVVSSEISEVGTRLEIQGEVALLCTIKDDDLPNDGAQLPGFRGWSTVIDVFRDAYVEVVAPPGVGQVPFRAHVYTRAQMRQVFQLDGSTGAPDRWRVYGLMGFEGLRSLDNDPDEEREERLTFAKVDGIPNLDASGKVTGPRGSGFIVFAAQLAECSDCDDTSNRKSLGHIMAHEIAHLFGGSHEDEGLMSFGSGSRFSAATLHKIRLIDFP